MSTIILQKASITDLRTDAIVNAANAGLQAGGGVCGAIFKAAGHEQLQAACDAIGHCDTGSAVITPGFNLKAKYIIHAVGPVWHDGKHGEPKLLYSAYYHSLELAIQNHCHSIGFPLISSGIFGCPIKDAWYEALGACRDFLDEHPDISLDIIFAILNEKIMQSGREAFLGSSASKYKIAERSDWKISSMPTQHDSFILNRTFTPKQMAVLRRGNIPQEMEDKWFWYMEGKTLYAHRSWTGFCIYRIEFKADGNHVVTVNRNPKQYSGSSIEDDKATLNKLLDWWIQEDYDYYGEWLSETVDSMKKAGMVPDQLKVAGKEFDAVFFHKPEEPNGWLSNWYPSPFTMDGIPFSSVEQYIMYAKCQIFGDEASAKLVLATDDPSKQQLIGRNAKGYLPNVWAGMRQMILFQGLMGKFTQDEELKQKLQNTGDAWLVECAKSDKIWACGIALDDDRRFDAAQWAGQNILGFALMQVRDMIR